MLNEREKFLVRMALIYAHANVDDLNEAFGVGEDSTVVLHDHATGVHQTAACATAAEVEAVYEKLIGKKLD